MNPFQQVVFQGNNPRQTLTVRGTGFVIASAPATLGRDVACAPSDAECTRRNVWLQTFYADLSSYRKANGLRPAYGSSIAYHPRLDFAVAVADLLSDKDNALWVQTLRASLRSEEAGVCCLLSADCPAPRLAAALTTHSMWSLAAAGLSVISTAQAQGSGPGIPWCAEYCYTGPLSSRSFPLTASHAILLGAGDSLHPPIPPASILAWVVGIRAWESSGARSMDCLATGMILAATRITGFPVYAVRVGRAFKEVRKLHLLAYAAISGFMMCAAFPAVASAQPQSDLAGITSNKDFHNGAELQPADVQFYLRIMRAAVARYQHPTAQDVADIAETKRLRQLLTSAQAKIAADSQTGKSYQVIQADAFVPTSAQTVVMNRGTDLLSGNAAEILAANEGMPGYQWDTLRQTVETAAGLHDGDRFGSGEGPTILTPEQRERAARIIKVRADNRQLVAKDAAEIKRLNEQTAQLTAASTQAA